MKSPLRLVCAVALASTLLLSSCISPYYPGPHETAGGVVGAVAGAAVGGIIGHQSCYGLEGAAIGAVAGSWLGSAAGYSHDRYVYGYPEPRPVVRRYYYSDYYEPRYYGYCPPPVYYHRYHSHCW